MSAAKKIIAFVIVSFLLYGAAVFLLSRFGPGTYPLIYGLSDGLNLKGGNSYQKFREFDKSRHYAVIVIGSSHAYRGYDPRIFENNGFEMFNLGSSSQTPYNSFHIIDELLSERNCGLLLFDVFHVALQMDGLESTSDLVANTRSDMLALNMALGHRDPRTLNMFSVRMVSRDLDPFYKDSAYVGSGFSENRNAAGQEVEYPEDGGFKLVDRQREFLHRSIALCRERGIELVLVDHPLPKEMRGRRLAESNAWIKRVAKEHGVPFIDLSKAPGFSSEGDFYDHTHLNQGGVDSFNELLIRELLDLYILEKD